MNYLVIPSNRENNLKEFLAKWSDENFNLIVIEDNETKTFNIDVHHHYSWKEIDADLGNNSWIISRSDSAIRSYGFLLAYRLGAEYIFTLDDDCYPLESFCTGHIERLEKTPKWTNTAGVRTRGMPYYNLGVLPNVVANIGLWTGTADYDCIQALSLPKTHFVPSKEDHIVARNQYVSFCGMNMAIKREVAVLAYFALMGRGQPYRRFDDIFMGIIFKKICDHLNLSVACGHPYVYHSRASDPFVNLVKEAPGIAYNETFWEIIDKIELKGKNAKDCMFEIGYEMKKMTEPLRGITDSYLNKYGSAITTWTNYF